MLTAIKTQLAQSISPAFDSLSQQEIIGLFENPKKIEFGLLALPVFVLAKKWRQAPPLIAKELSQTINSLNIAEIDKTEPVGGYINFHLKADYVQTILCDSVSQENVGHSRLGAGKKVVIDFSSPNVAKPMSVGHLRATVIGQAICNLAQSQGYEVVGLNHLGDWGVQFGKLAWAFNEWGDESAFKEQPFESLYKLYVRFHEEAEDNKELEVQGSLTFKKLEEGDPQIVKLWQMFVDISLKEYQRLWDILGVKHDLVRGESFYNDRLRSTEKLLEDKGLLKESEGAMVVELDDDMPPCLIRKSDGASLYATRDITSAIYRTEDLKADVNLYVVGVDQTLHFRQVFKVLEKMHYPWSKNCHHISFGMYKFKDIGKMSTRKGNVIFLEDVIKRAIDSVEKIIEQKNPDLPNKQLAALRIGVGAIIFNDLNNDRVKNVDFDWDKVLDFEGDSGPYVQYCQARCNSLIKKYAKDISLQMQVSLSSPEEKALIKVLLHYEETLSHAYGHFKPHILANYLLDVCRDFNHFYHKHRILGEDPQLEASRMTLVVATRKIIIEGLSVLNITCPEAM